MRAECRGLHPPLDYCLQFQIQISSIADIVTKKAEAKSWINLKQRLPIVSVAERFMR